MFPVEDQCPQSTGALVIKQRSVWVCPGQGISHIIYFFYFSQRKEACVNLFSNSLLRNSLLFATKSYAMGVLTLCAGYG